MEEDEEEDAVAGAQPLKANLNGTQRHEELFHLTETTISTKKRKKLRSLSQPRAASWGLA